MTSDHLRQAARTYESAFAFLAEEFGLEPVETAFQHGGFALNYHGAEIGVRIDWYPRDPVTVWLVRPAARPDSFDLEDVEIISGHVREVADGQLYTPSDENARLLADNLRIYAGDLLRGDLTRVPALEERIRERAERFGQSG